ncbi:hypothetical protein LCGC14_2906640 [marine sediment metagenome]|uniref:ATP-dependent DNA ligase family profile domain-containing protein n=1 Tax=marine sediment metagenome TaxID=412755 RepID=A0A0F8XST5_9ZZZZ
MQCTLAHKYDFHKDVTGWWMSEKYDGIRAIWDGENFMSRTEKLIQAPEWFKEGLPKGVTLDGELWCGRGEFQKTVGIVRSHEGNSDWSSVKYMVFDIVVDRTTVGERLELLDDLECSQPGGCFPHVEVVHQTICEDLDHLKEFELQILNAGGEGVMLKAPNSMYEYKRTKKLLKMKRMKKSIADVVGYTPGKGRHEGKVGALLCNWMLDCGPELTVRKIAVGSGLTDLERENPPEVGSVIKIKYFDVTEAGMPRFPVYEGVL